jgi:hypothetical protein
MTSSGGWKDLTSSQPIFKKTLTKIRLVHYKMMISLICLAVYASGASKTSMVGGIITCITLSLLWLISGALLIAQLLQLSHFILLLDDAKSFACQ